MILTGTVTVSPWTSGVLGTGGGGAVLVTSRWLPTGQLEVTLPGYDAVAQADATNLTITGAIPVGMRPSADIVNGVPIQIRANNANPKQMVLPSIDSSGTLDFFLDTTTVGPAPGPAESVAIGNRRDSPAVNTNSTTVLHFDYGSVVIA